MPAITHEKALDVLKDALRRVRSVGARIQMGRFDKGSVIADLEEIDDMLSVLIQHEQQGVRRSPYRGYRPNPQLVIYNPPDLRVRRVAPGRVVGQIASNVHEIRYEHAEDGKLYKHEFSRGVKMFAINGGSHEVLLTSDNPLWEDF